MPKEPYIVYYAWHWPTKTLHRVDGYKANDDGFIMWIIIRGFELSVLEYDGFKINLN